MPWAAPTHKAKHAPRQKADANRPNSNERGYTSGWRRIRKRFLQQHPFCCECERAATDVDHRIPLSAGGTHDEKNLRPLCHSCHSKVTSNYKRTGVNELRKAAGDRGNKNCR